MSDPVVIALIMAGASVPPAAAAFAAAYFSYKAATHSKENLAVSKQALESTNGKMDHLMKLTASAAHAEGMKDEKDHPGVVR